MLIYVTEVSKGTMLVNPAHIVTAESNPDRGGITHLTFVGGTDLLVREDLATICRHIGYVMSHDVRMPA